MKYIKLLPALSLASLPCFMSAQTDENTLPPEYLSVNDPALQEWEAYFEKNFFSKGIPADSLGEGTGFLPYLREKRLYEMRKDYRGDAGGSRRWDIFHQIRSRSLERGGPIPAADWQNLGPNKMENMGGRMISHAFEPGNSQVIWAGSVSGGLWRSENGGTVWSQTTSSPGWRVTDIKSSPLQAGVIYVSRNSSQSNVAHIYKSTNFGDSWTPIQGDLPDLSVNALAVHHFAPGVVFAATDLGVFITTDDGQHWTEYNDNLPVTFAMDIQFNPADTTVLVGTLGRGAWRTKAWMPDESSAANEPVRKDGFGIRKLSPNPASDNARIDYFLEKNANVRVDILNTMGQKITTLFSGKLSAGQHEATWNGLTSNGLRAQSGVYFVRLTVGEEAVLERLVRH